jgi:hypothetical protein
MPYGRSPGVSEVLCESLTERSIPPAAADLPAAQPARLWQQMKMINSSGTVTNRPGTTAAPDAQPRRPTLRRYETGSPLTPVAEASGVPQLVGSAADTKPWHRRPRAFDRPTHV